jgi:hypothetical protein
MYKHDDVSSGWRRIMGVRFVHAVLLGGAMVVAGAQPKPDFSGDWTLNREASTLSPAVTSVRSGAAHIEHREPAFKYKVTMAADGSPIEYAFELTTDGREVTASQQGRESVSSLRWDGDALMFVARTHSANSDLTITFRYELLDGGRRLRATEQLRGTRVQDNVWVFDRK